MFIAMFENICGTGDTIENAIDDFQHTYGCYNPADAPFTDIVIYEVYKPINVSIKYEIMPD